MSEVLQESGSPDLQQACRRGLSAFTCDWSEAKPGSVWLRVAGELDCATVPGFAEAVRRAQIEARRIVLDLRGLSFMDCSGLHTILAANERAQRVGDQLAVVGAAPQIHRLFALTGASDVLTLVEVASTS